MTRLFLLQEPQFLRNSRLRAPRRLCSCFLGAAAWSGELRLPSCSTCCILCPAFPAGGSPPPAISRAWGLPGCGLQASVLSCHWATVPPLFITDLFPSPSPVAPPFHGPIPPHQMAALSLFLHTLISPPPSPGFKAQARQLGVQLGPASPSQLSPQCEWREALLGQMGPQPSTSWGRPHHQCKAHRFVLRTTAFLLIKLKRHQCSGNVGLMVLILGRGRGQGQGFIGRSRMNENCQLPAA